MVRTISILIAAVLLIGCTAGAPASVAPTRSAAPSVDIKQAKLDISYTAIAENHYAAPTSRALLTAALDAFRAEAKAAGSSVVVETPQFEDMAEPIIPDFEKFAAAALTIARATPQISADRFADRAIAAMLSVKPDCHAYFSGRGSSFQSLPVTGGARPPVTKPDQAGLEARLIDGRIGYITWHEYVLNGTYDIRATVRAALDQLVAQGARSWLFDLRANIGGSHGAVEIMYSWFLNGEAVMRAEGRDGRPTTSSARKELRLPDEYQLPMVVLLNGGSGSGPEVFTLALKELGRATVVGKKSAGCLGTILPLTLRDGTTLAVPNAQFVGAVTGARFNGLGIPPDVPADDQTAIAVGSRILEELMTKAKP